MHYTKKKKNSRTFLIIALFMSLTMQWAVALGESEAWDKKEEDENQNAIAVADLTSNIENRIEKKGKFLEAEGVEILKGDHIYTRFFSKNKTTYYTFEAGDGTPIKTMPPKWVKLEFDAGRHHLTWTKKQQQTPAPPEPEQTITTPAKPEQKSKAPTSPKTPTPPPSMNALEAQRSVTMGKRPAGKLERRSARYKMTKDKKGADKKVDAPQKQWGKVEKKTDAYKKKWEDAAKEE